MVVNKARLLFIFSLFVLFSVMLDAQDLSQNISLKIKNEPLETVLQKISMQCDIHFSYSSQQIPVYKRINLRCKNKSVKEVLEKICNENQITYKIVEHQIVLTSKEENQSHISNEKYTMSGFVRDKNTGEVLIGASIYISEKSIGTETNPYGYFSIYLNKGLYHVYISYLGYKTYLLDTLLNQPIFLSVSMTSDTIEIPLIEVTGNDTSLMESYKNLNKASQKEICQSVGITGNADAIKTLQYLPGINSLGDGSSFFFVRGGNNFQNLILIDDAPIYNPSHLFGYFTSVVPNAIKDMTVYKGDFPANYGGRLSSVIDIRTKDGNLYHSSFSGNMNPFVSDISMECPLSKGKSSIFISARKSNIDWINWYRKSMFTYRILFFDMNTKINFKVTDYNYLFFTAYVGYDDFSLMKTNKIRNVGISWNNLLSTLRWNHIFNQKLFSNTTAYISRYNYYLYFSNNSDDYWNSSVLKQNIKTDFTYFANPKLTVKTGLEVGTLFLNPGYISVYSSFSNTLPSISKYHTNHIAFYFSNEQHFLSKLLFNYGVRITYWQDVGPTDVFVFDAYHHVIDTLSIPKNSSYSSFFVLEPRIKAIYSFNPKNLIHATYNRTYQMENIISNSVSPFNSIEMLIPSGPNILPQKADLFSLGFVHLFNKKYGITMENTLFYQFLYSQLDYKEHANLLFNPLLEGELRFGKTQAYGNEFLLKKNSGKITGWLSYTYSHVYRKTDEINNNNRYPAINDRPHNITVNLAMALYKRWNVALNWQYISGTVTTIPVGFYYYNGYSVPVYDKKNNSRLPDYHRLDISCTFQLNKKPHRYSHKLTLSVYNVYRRKNPISLNFDKIEDAKGNYVIPSDFYNNRTLLTTIISVAGIVPSITYKFNFQ